MTTSQEIEALHKDIKISADRTYHILCGAGIDSKVLNEKSYLWLLQTHINEYIEEYPFNEKLPFEKSANPETTEMVLTGFFDAGHQTGLLQLFNLLETGTLNKPIHANDFLDLIDLKCQKYRNIDRKSALLKAGAIDEQGNIQEAALERVRKQYAKLK
jgi:hypothetical protein